ncbi:collagen col-34, partial [Aphelenchoides avenae]
SPNQRRPSNPLGQPWILRTGLRLIASWPTRPSPSRWSQSSRSASPCRWCTTTSTTCAGRCTTRSPTA